MKNSEKIFLDTSFFKAFIDLSDDFHTKSLEQWGYIKANKVNLITSNYILDESFTLIRSRNGVKIVDELRTLLLASTSFLSIQRVTTKDEAAAWNWFLKDWSGLSFTDCVSFAQMKRLHIEKVATFDQDFQRAGFFLL